MSRKTISDYLKEWNLEKYIQVFEDEEIDIEDFLDLAPEKINQIFPKAGPYSRFMKNFKKLKGENDNDSAVILSSMKSVPWVDYKGTKYAEHRCVAVSVNHESLPVFGVIRYILLTEHGEICLISKLLSTISYEPDLYAYSVSECDQWRCIEIQDLISPFPVIYCTMANGFSYITLKQSL